MRDIPDDYPELSGAVRTAMIPENLSSCEYLAEIDYNTPAFGDLYDQLPL
jgi:hypothetical protein